MAEVTLESIARQLESSDRWRAVTEKRLESIHKTLYGNGEPGWDEMLRDISRRITKLETDSTAKKQDETSVRVAGMTLSAGLLKAVIDGLFVLLGVLAGQWLIK